MIGLCSLLQNLAGLSRSMSNIFCIKYVLKIWRFSMRCSIIEGTTQGGNNHRRFFSIFKCDIDADYGGEPL